MRAPEFWWQAKPGPAAGLLAPAAWAYGLVARRRMAAVTPERAGVPVVCVGNLVAGGAGKTPVALDLAVRLAARGVAVHFLTRGYGGRVAGPLRVDPAVHRFAEVGDEALLLARRAPAWVARDRAAGARAAVAAGARTIVMDDGFQNPSLVKDLALIVVDGRRGFGNGRLLPAGPLRERSTDGLGRADAVVLIGDDERGAAALIEAAAPRPLPILRARLAPGPGAAELAGQAVVAFAGIGDPAKFFATLEGLDCRLEATFAFADHHPYKAADLAAVGERAGRGGAVVVTTEKDAVRLPSGLPFDVRVLTIGIEWEDEAALETVLEPLGAELQQ